MSTTIRNRFIPRFLLRRSMSTSNLSERRGNDVAGVEHKPLEEPSNDHPLHFDDVTVDNDNASHVNTGMYKLGGHDSTTHIAEFERFTSSDTLNYLISHLPTDKTEWEHALKTALALTEKAFGNTHDPNGAVFDSALWKTTCTLLKANYYLQQSIPLERLRNEEWYQYSVHAAVGLLHPICSEKIVERLLVEFPDQIRQQEPTSLRYPLHIAALTPFKFSSLTMTRVVILDLLVQADSNMASVKDGQGQYPFTLAKKSGYRWKLGLESLWKASHQGSHSPGNCDEGRDGRRTTYARGNSYGNIPSSYGVRSVSSLDAVNEVLMGNPAILT